MSSLKSDAFKPAAQDAVVPGLVVSKKRRKATVTLNRDGLAGLNENAASVREGGRAA